MTLKGGAKFKGKLTHGLKNHKEFGKFSCEKLKICILMGYFCQKYVMFELKYTDELCCENDLRFQK